MSGMRWPVPRKEEISEALEQMGGGPTTVGPLAWQVCAVMGVDTSGCTGYYELRRVMSWTGYLRRLKELVDAGHLTAMPTQQWRSLTAGALFPDGNGNVQAYATVEAARRALASAPHPTACLAAARRAAEARVLAENSTLVERYLREWLQQNPAPGGNA